MRRQAVAALDAELCRKNCGDLEQIKFLARSALKEDPFFSELLEPPLMLWVAMLA